MKPRRTAAFAKPAAVSAACGGEWRLDRLQAVRHRALRGRWCRRDIHSTAAVCVLTLPSLSKWDKPSPTYAARAWSFGWSVNALPPLQHTTPCPATSTAAKDKRVRYKCTARQEHRSRLARSGGNNSQHWRACSRAVPGRAHLGGLHVKARRLWCRRERRRRSARVGRLRRRRAARVGALPRLRPIGWPRAARRGPGGVAVRVALGIGTRRCAWIPRRRRRPCTGAWELKGAPAAGPCRARLAGDTAL